MSLILGIHNGHHASCAIVRDGALVGAIEQERITRKKHDGQEGLSNRLPIHACLHAAGATLRDVDVIVSSFQAASPGGVGLHRPLVEPGFDLFDPSDRRHFVVSHHCAHALSALGASEFCDAAILVCDLAGSTTEHGGDSTLTFAAFEREITSLTSQAEPRTECLSVYEADESTLQLRYREYCVPHNTPDVFIQNVASLYDNVARTIFGKENAHGQLMALASMVSSGDRRSTDIAANDIVEIAPDGRVIFRNDWQHRVTHHRDILDYAPLAAVVQQALQCAVLQYVRKARTLTSSANLAAAGGVFLNIVANSEIVRSELFEACYVPSSPHDAGISVGCAYAGWRTVAERSRAYIRRKAIDRLGPIYHREYIGSVLRENRTPIFPAEAVEPSTIARMLYGGKIVARCAGRSEFGPRALGGRSLLASPLLSNTKERLNAIKGRQVWRPVAPIVTRERVNDFFEGPNDSPYMNLVHTILPPYRADLVALRHPDHSTRAQTIERSDDPYLYEILLEFEVVTGFPILVNTSLNGPGEPIAETPKDALEFFNSHPEVDALLLEDLLIRRDGDQPSKCSRMAPDTIVTIVYPLGRKRIILIRRDVSLEVSPETLVVIERQGKNGGEGGISNRPAEAAHVEDELAEAVRRGLLVPS